MSTPTEGESTEADAVPWNWRTTPAGERRPRVDDFRDRPGPRPTPPPASDNGDNPDSDRGSGGPGIPRREEPPVDQHEDDDGS